MHRSFLAIKWLYTCWNYRIQLITYCSFSAIKWLHAGIYHFWLLAYYPFSVIKWLHIYWNLLYLANYVLFVFGNKVTTCTCWNYHIWLIKCTYCLFLAIKWLHAGIYRIIWPQACILSIFSNKVTTCWNLPFLATCVLSILGNKVITYWNLP